MTLAEVDTLITVLEAEITKANISLACGQAEATETAATLTALLDTLTLFQIHREFLLAKN